MNILIMTATICPPPGAPGLLRTNPALRLSDYILALSHYLKFVGNGIDRIIFAENSNSDVSALRATVHAAGKNEQVEFLVYDGMDHPPVYGRCYSESRLLDHVMSHSTTVGECHHNDDFFWKVTGRYSLLNLRSMIRRKPEFHFYCDLRSKPSPWADMRFMAWTKTGYTQVFHDIGPTIREDLNHGRPGEETLHKRLSERLPVQGFRTVLSREPLFNGVRAFDNKNWSQGRQYLVYLMRQVQRIMLRRVVV